MDTYPVSISIRGAQGKIASPGTEPEIGARGRAETGAMVWTLDRTSGVDLLIDTGTVFGPSAGTFIFAPGTTNQIADINVTGHTWLTMPGTEIGTLNGNGASDRLVTGSTNDLVIWDAASMHDLLFHDLTLFGRARLPSSTGAVRLEIFELGAGNDVLNLTASSANLPTGNSPGNYNWSVTAYGGDGNDVLAAGEADDVLVGDANDGQSSSGVRSDTIWGLGGNDTIYGDDGSTALDETVGGADMLLGGEGNDLIRGEGGDDHIEGQSGSDTLYGGGGNDLIYGEDPAGVDLLSNFPDTIYGGIGNDTVYGGVGGDLIHGDAGADRLFGGSGDDSAAGGAGGDALFGEAGADTLDGGVGPDQLFGGEGNDFLRGGGGGASLIDTLYGGAGDDTLQLDPDTVLNGGELRAWDGIGNSPVLIGFAAAANLAPDLFFGDGGFDTLLLNDGSDVLTAWDGDVQGGALVYGNGGSQRLTGVELVLAGGGEDYVLLNHLSTGGGDPNRIFSESITIAGMGGSDTVFAGSGNDVLWGDALGNAAGAAGDGNDFLAGGAGSDTIYGAGGDDVLHTGGGQLVGIDQERAFGGDGNDTLYGGGGVDSLYGGAGDDRIENAGSGAAGEYFDGGAGADILLLQLSHFAVPTTIVAGPDNVRDGDDYVQVFGKYGAVTATLGHGNDTYIAEYDPRVAQDVKNADSVSGGAGADLISTWFGDDYLDGGADGDALWGGSGADTIFGGAGVDFLYGGTGVDTLYGGAQTDFYYWSREDGQGDQIYDEFRLGQTLTDNNGIVVFGVFDTATGTPIPGTGVFEEDLDITDADGMVRVYDIPEGKGELPGVDLWRLEIIDGEGAGNFVDFDRRDVSQIALSNHDPGPDFGVQRYVWDDAAMTYVYFDGLASAEASPPPTLLLA
ncbi:MAG: calcium-binding protein [Reyranellaceae bacterium]